jgi:hypothetical protein
MLMNSLTSSGTDNLPQAVLPPEPKIAQTAPQAEEDPLFEEVEVVQENTQTNDNLDQIAQKLKEESRQEAEVVATPVAEEEIKPQPVKEEVKKRLRSQNLHSNKHKQNLLRVHTISKWVLFLPTSPINNF